MPTGAINHSDNRGREDCLVYFFKGVCNVQTMNSRFILDRSKISILLFCVISAHMIDLMDVKRKLGGKSDEYV